MATHHENQNVYTLLENSIYKALETYSNVHRGSGYKSMVTTYLFDKARTILLDHLKLNNKRYTAIFCTPYRAELLTKQLSSKHFIKTSSNDIGLSLGVTVVAVKKNAFPKNAPFHSGGGTARLISKNWVLWENAPDKFEAGTPAIMNIIAFACALKLTEKYGKDCFARHPKEEINIENLLNHNWPDNLSEKEKLNELIKTAIGNKIEVPTTNGLKPFINFDSSASTPTFEPIWDTFRSSLCLTEKDREKIIQEVKSLIARFLNAPLDKYDIVFTSNATEAINVTAENFKQYFKNETESVVLNTLMEHSSNDLPWRINSGSELIRINVNSDGFIDIDELERILKQYNQENKDGNKTIRMLALSGASNVLGSCNNLEEISKLVKKYKAHFFVDAAQLVAHRKVDIEKSSVDYLAFSAHKMYAPFGCGVLLVKKGLLKINPEELNLIHSSGEENLAGIAALGKSIALLQQIGMDTIQQEEQEITAQLLDEMSQIPELKIYGIDSKNHPEFQNKLGVISFDMKRMMADVISKQLCRKYGFGVRYGCHCAHIIIKHMLNIGPRLEKFQKLMLTLFPKMQLPGVTRISLGIENTKEDIGPLIQALKAISKKTKDSPEELSVSEFKKQMEVLMQQTAETIYSF